MLYYEINQDTLSSFVFLEQFCIIESAGYFRPIFCPSCHSNDKISAKSWPRAIWLALSQRVIAGENLSYPVTHTHTLSLSLSLSLSLTHTFTHTRFYLPSSLTLSWLFFSSLKPSKSDAKTVDVSPHA